MNYPKIVYAIFPLDEKCEVAGVYVGSTDNLKSRIKNHRNSKKANDSQAELHELMRANGFSYIVLDEIKTWKDNHIEYDWIDYFIERTSLRVFNSAKELCGADYTRISREPLKIPLVIPELYDEPKTSYPNLKREMKNKGMNLKDLSKASGIRYNSLTEKMRGVNTMFLRDAVKIKNALKTDVPLEVLFEKKEVRE